MGNGDEGVSVICFVNLILTSFGGVSLFLFPNYILQLGRFFPLFSSKGVKLSWLA